MVGERYIRIRTWGIAAAVAAVALTAACGVSQSSKGASVGASPLAGEGIGAGGVPGADAATPPQPCGPPATAASWNGPLPGPNDPVPAGGTLDKIRQRGFLIAGIDLNTELFGYDPQHDNNPQGFDVDIARQLARDVFGADGHIQFRVVTLADPETGEYAQLHNRNVDLVVRTTTITCARMQGAKRMSFSNPYYTAEQKLLMALGDDGKPRSAALEDLRGSVGTVCATMNSTAIDTIKQKAGDQAPFPVANALDCLAYLQQDQVSAIFTDDALLRGMMSQDPHVAITTAPAVQKQPYGVVTNYDASTPNDLTPFVNTALAAMIQDPGPNGWRSLFAKDLGSQPASLPEIPAQYPLG